MDTACEKMLGKGSIGKMVLKNRIVLPPMVRNYATDKGEVTSRLMNHYETIARGGVGMIIIEASFIHPNGRGFVNQLGIYEDRLIPGLRSLAQAVQTQGVKVGVQIHHSGRQTTQKVSGFQPVAPSPIPCPLMSTFFPGEVPRELTTEEVERMVGAYAEAARRNREAGFDFVEIHGAHGYLITQFLSPLTNHRTDKYGGDFTGRMRFLLEIVEKIRKQVGPDYPVTCRLSGSEFVEGGMDLAYTQRVVQELDKAGVDAFHISGEIYASSLQGHQIPPMAVPPCPLVKFAEGVKQITSKPVIAVSKINRPEMVEGILERKQADFVATGRWLLADPEWPNKIKAGRLEDINFCISCNQGCHYRLSSQLDVQCTVNPWVGREIEMAVKPASRRKKVMVVGGGPSGMEAAWVAAERGHQVTLYEKTGQLGGQFILAAIPPNREDIAVFTKFQVRQIKETGVKVVTGQEVSPELIRAEEPEVVVVATGSTQLRPSISGIDGENVVDAREVLREKVTTKDTVIVAGGGMIGCEVAEYLAEKGKKVNIVEMLSEVALDMPRSERYLLLARLEKLGVKIFANRKILKITHQGVVVKREERKENIIGETVVLAMGSEPDRRLARVLKGLVPEVYAVGDCVEARKGLEAIYEGAKVGCQI